jgi:hypothetical protein
MRLKLAITLLSFTLTTSTGVVAASEQHIASLNSFSASAVNFGPNSTQSLPPSLMATPAQVTSAGDSGPTMAASSLFGAAQSEPLQSSEPSRWLMMLVALFLVCYQLRRKHRSLQLQHIAGF